jgi:hypothetical protein
MHITSLIRKKKQQRSFSSLERDVFNIYYDSDFTNQAQDQANIIALNIVQGLYFAFIF